MDDALKLKLFISHSSRLDEFEDSNDPEKNPNLKLLLDVIAGIRHEYGESIEILVDKDEQCLPAGIDWEKRLNEWLSECHAAVILFSKRAIENSNWVKKEATILSWRRELEKDFILIPVCIEGQTTPEDLEEGIFKTLRITKNQCIRRAADSADIVEGIKLALGDKEILEGKCRQTPFDRLEGVITELLIKDATPEALADAWRELPDIDKPHCNPQNKVKFANSLTRYLIRDGAKCLKNFKCVIDKIRPRVEKEHAEEVLKYIRSLWVDAKAAGCIPSARNHKSFIVMNGRFLVNYTCERYTERAWPISDLYMYVPTTHSDGVRLIDEIRDFFQPKTVKLTPEECDEHINELVDPVVVYSPAEQNGGGLLDDPRLRSKLRTKYPDIIFLLGTGKSLPSLRAGDIRLVEPELDLNLEKISMLAEDDITKFLDKYYGH